MSITLPGQRILTPTEWAQLKRMQEVEAAVPSHQGSDFVGMTVRPRKITFANQNRGEKVYLLMRRHWTTNLSWVFNQILYALLPIVAAAVLNLLNINVVEFVGVGLLTIVLIIYYSLIVTSVIRNITNWYFNLYLVTNERLIRFTLNLLAASKSINETRLENISDVKETQAGILSTFFNYGDISVFTEAERNIIKLEEIPYSTLARDIITDLAKVAQKYAGDKAEG